MDELIITENLKIIKDIDLENNYHILIVEQIINDSTYYLVGEFYNSDPIVLNIYDRIEMILTEKYNDEKFLTSYEEAEKEFERQLTEYSNREEKYEEITIIHKKIR